MALPEKYDPKAAEPRLREWWESERIYAFDRESDAEIYAVDTPPPTVSGKMHLGHSFSYTQQDVIVRYKRMKGFNVFYPFGTDDNGLATERLVEKMNNVKGSRMDRGEFIKLCEKTLETIRPDFVADWKKIGISADFTLFYSTIDDHSRKISQKSFLDLFNAGRIYRTKRPIMICPLCQTAIAQVEMQDESKNSTLNYLKAQLETGDYLIYATTRPELLPACIGMSVHEEGIYVRVAKGGEIWVLSKEAFDRFKEKWQLTLKEEITGKHIVGKTVTLPLTKSKLVVVHDPEAKTEYGSGVVYWCSYGGVECVDFMGRHKGIKPIDIMDLSGKYVVGPYKGMGSLEARKQILDDYEKEGSLVVKEPISHVVNVHERCGTDIEYVATEQWFVRYLDLQEKFLEAGGKLRWHPKHMQNRLDNWIKGLRWDWCISRQRFFGVPFPIWYCKKCKEPVTARKEDLPVDPLKDVPPISSCPKCSGKEFVPEKDVLDTWATSSMTPQIAAALIPEMYDKLYPMSMRPQAHDIISFWLFNTMVKSQMHNNINPWDDVVISGWALDPHGKKMSKSKGNVIEPQIMVDKYSADSLRFWASGSKLGEDMPFQEKDLVSGQKLVTKLWNASKFVLQHLAENEINPPENINPMDRWILSKLQGIIGTCTAAFEQFEYSKAKVAAEVFFWHDFCDNYLELVKDRLYNSAAYPEDAVVSARYTLYKVLYKCLLLFAPFVPHITEEIYQNYFKEQEGHKSIHIAPWPVGDEELQDSEMEAAGDICCEILSLIRKHKSENSKSLKEPVKELTITCDGYVHESIKPMLSDLRAVTKAEHIIFGPGGEKQCETADVKVKVQL